MPLAEVGPAVVVGRDDHGRSQDRGRGCRPDALQAQRAVPELARDAGGAGVQDGRVDGRGAPGDLGDGRDRGVVPRLREKPSMARFVFDEALRYESPVQTFFRTTTREVEVSGVRIPEGGKVLLFLGAAISVAGCGRPPGSGSGAHLVTVTTPRASARRPAGVRTGLASRRPRRQPRSASFMLMGTAAPPGVSQGQGRILVRGGGAADHGLPLHAPRSPNSVSRRSPTRCRRRCW